MTSIGGAAHYPAAKSAGEESAVLLDDTIAAHWMKMPRPLSLTFPSVSSPPALHCRGDQTWISYGVTTPFLHTLTTSFAR